MQASTTIFAIIPAAGRSSRMGRPKQLLEVAGKPMLLAVVEPIVACDAIAAVAVVTNSLVASTLDLADAGAVVTLNDEPDAEMIDSVRVGIGELQRRYELEPNTGILICPGDQPGLHVGDIARCCDAFKDQLTKIVIAAHGGKTGHPLIFPASMIPFVMSPACDTGLRELPESQPDTLVAVDLDSPAVVRNINTPDDYDRLTRP